MMLRWLRSRFSPVERFNQIVWAIIGTGIVGLAAVLLIAGLVALVSSMVSRHSAGLPVAMVEGEATDEQGKKSAQYDICMPLEMRGSSYQLIKVVSDQFVIRNVKSRMKLAKVSGDSYLEAPVSNGCRIYGSNRQTGVVNVILRDPASNAMRLMLKENAQIRVMDYPQPLAKNSYGADADAFPPDGAIYWEIAFEDTNKDGEFDEKDDIGAYLSDLDGSHMTRITPAHSRVLERSYNKARNVLMMRILKDGNNDQSLDETDKPSLIEVSVAARQMTREVLDAQTLTGMLRQSEPKRVDKE